MKRLSEEDVRVFVEHGTRKAKAMATELLELRAFRDAVLTVPEGQWPHYAFGGHSENPASCGPLCEAIKAERVRRGEG